MSYQIGLDAINLRPTPRLAHTEYCSNAALLRAVTGRVEETPEAWREFMDRWEYDLIWSTDDGPQPWSERGRVTDMGHSDFVEGGRDRREPRPCPFRNVEEVLSFDAVAEYGLPDLERLVDYYRARYSQARAEHPEQVWTGGYYKTIVSGAIEAFGWDMLLEAAAHRDRFARVLDSFYRLALHHVKAWARTPIEVFMCHDDMVWSQGPFMHPGFYRAEIFPRYRALWSVLREAGKKVIFCSDGQWGMFVDDVVEAGADGLCFEPMVALEPVVARFGQTHCIISSKVDARTLTLGSKAEIQAEVDATLPLARGCRGFIFAVGNHIPSNVPVENALFYFRYLRERWRR
ncbi:MAG: uroporphyrinogen decarboxylase family protein [Anaerolineae bacterium]|nr:uroporphyrinogen decarboxylase family protein [Anaerolineae bacterium]